MDMSLEEAQRIVYQHKAEECRKEKLKYCDPELANGVDIENNKVFKRLCKFVKKHNLPLAYGVLKPGSMYIDFEEVDGKLKQVTKPKTIARYTFPTLDEERSVCWDIDFDGRSYYSGCNFKGEDNYMTLAIDFKSTYNMVKDMSLKEFLKEIKKKTL